MPERTCRPTAKGTSCDHIHSPVLGGEQAGGFVKGRQSFPCVAGQLLRREVFSLLDDKRLPSLLGEVRSGDSTASAGSDDENVRLDDLERRVDGLEYVGVVGFYTRLRLGSIGVALRGVACRQRDVVDRRVCEGRRVSKWRIAAWQRGRTGDKERQA